MDFFQTRMGMRFFEHTAPELVRQLDRLNGNLERIAALFERLIEPREKRPQSDQTSS
jgi:hypothetical protein